MFTRTKSPERNELYTIAQREKSSSLKKLVFNCQWVTIVKKQLFADITRGTKMEDFHWIRVQLLHV